MSIYSIVGIAWFIIGLVNAGLAAYAEGKISYPKYHPMWVDWARVILGPFYIITTICKVIRLKSRY